MKIAVIKEIHAEPRVAISADTVKKYISLGFSVEIETGAGIKSNISDEIFKEAGATIGETAQSTCIDADVLLTVRKPNSTVFSSLKENAIVIGMFSPLENPQGIQEFADSNLRAFSMELLPRITRAQSMDVLSSQSNLSGYRAVIEASHTLNKVIPMMMTPAGTVTPVKAMILGVGVAGLQAIATAKRLGAIVCATDVRSATKEQVESLGAKFVMVESEESGDATGGYAKEMSKEYQEKQKALVHETIKQQDMVICTALIPGRKAPTLITEEMLKDMKDGAVVVDLAASHGGNCVGVEPDKIVTKEGVKIIGYTNTAGLVSVDSTTLYAKNLYNFLSPMVKEGQIEVNLEDEVITGTLLTNGGKIINARLIPEEKIEAVEEKVEKVESVEKIEKVESVEEETDEEAKEE